MGGRSSDRPAFLQQFPPVQANRAARSLGLAISVIVFSSTFQPPRRWVAAVL